MPIYEYECSCGHGYETITTYAKREEAACPECGGTSTPLPSKTYFRPERMYVTDPDTGHRLVKNDVDSPWTGAGVEVENQQREQAEQRARATKRQTKIQVDHGSKTNVGAIH